MILRVPPKNDLEPPKKLKKAMEKYSKQVKGKPFVIICNDYAGLELRIMTLYTRDRMMAKFLRDETQDVHQNTADGLNIDRDPDAKFCNFLLQYGGTAWALAETLTNAGVPTTPEQAQVYLDTWDGIYPGVRLQRDFWCGEHQRLGFITYFTGRRRWIDDIDWNRRNHAHKAETTLSNNAVQGVGQDFLKAAIVRTDWQCINIDRGVIRSGLLEELSGSYNPRLIREHRLLLKEYADRVDKARKTFKLARLAYALQVHDELIHFCLEEAAEEVAPIVSEMMCWKHPFPRHFAYRYCVPLVAEGGVGYNWLQAKCKDKQNPPLMKLNTGWKSYELEEIS